MPYRYKTLYTKKRAVISVIVLTVVIALIDIYNLVIYRLDNIGQCALFQHTDWDIHFGIYIYPYIRLMKRCIVPFTIIIICNVILIYCLKRAERHRDEMSASNSDSERNSLGELTLMLIAVSFTYLVLTLPTNIMDPVSNVLWDPFSRKREAQIHLFIQICIFLDECNAAVNVLLYCVSGSTFRNEAARLLCSWRQTP